MNNLRFEIKKVFSDSVKSFHRFPAAIASALVISITALVRITMDWETQEVYTLLFDSIQLSFLLGAAFSMAALAWEEVSEYKTKSSFILANISGLLIAGISFILLYFYGGRVGEDNLVYLSSIARARVGVAVLVSALAFLYIISQAKALDNFSDSFFITHKAFITSAIYGLVIMIGVSGVVGAFQTLIYRGLDYRVYQYLGVAVGLFTYTIFLGYFPSFRAREDLEEIEDLKEKSRFIFVLFEYILIPIMLALTVVLLIWSVRVLLQGIDVSFNELSGIALSYVVVGIWLHIMVAKHETKMAGFYKRVYPFAGVLILVFEAWALFVQLSKFGLKTAEYSFLMIWIFTTISVLLLIFFKDRAYRKITITAAVISLIWVLPLVGYQDITFNSQVKRLEKILVGQELLVNDKIIAADKEVEYIKRGEITDGVDFLSYSEKTNTPSWFKKDLDDEDVFENTFGFKKTYGLYPDESDYSSISFSLKTEAIDISDYSLSLNIIGNEETDKFNKFEGKKGTYEIMVTSESEKTPKIILKLEDNIIVEKDMGEYLSDLISKYPTLENHSTELALKDMNMIVEDENISMLLVFESIDVYEENNKDKRSYAINLNGIYVKYK